MSTDSTDTARLAADAVRAVLYLRISKDVTGEQLGVSRQEDACRAICEARGWGVLDAYTDNDISATDARKVRPAYDEMIRDYDAGKFNALVCYDLDRLTRQPRQLEDWIDRAEQRGLRLVTANGEADLTTDGGRMYARIKAAVARAEVERKAARQKSANLQRAQQGKPYWATRPFGFEKDGRHREDEAVAIRRCYRGVLAGVPLTHLAQQLTDEGFRTVQGNGWSRTSLGPVLRNRRNIGELVFKGQNMGKGQWEPIVDEATFNAAVRILEDPSRKTWKVSTGRGRPPAYLLSGIAVCGLCGGNVGIENRARFGFHVYVCRKGHCTSARQHDADMEATATLLALLPIYQQHWLGPRSAASAERAETLLAEKADLEGRKQDAASAFAAGALDIAQLSTITEGLNTRLGEIADELSSITLADEGSPMQRHTRDILARAAEFQALTIAQRRSMVRNVFDRVVIEKRGRGLGKPAAVLTLTPHGFDSVADAMAVADRATRDNYAD